MSLDEIKRDVAKGIRELSAVADMLDQPTPQRLRVAERIIGTVSKDLGWTAHEIGRLAEQSEDMQTILDEQEADQGEQLASGGQRDNPIVYDGDWPLGSVDHSHVHDGDWPDIR